jgi:hypothetical protein
MNRSNFSVQGFFAGKTGRTILRKVRAPYSNRVLHWLAAKNRRRNGSVVIAGKQVPTHKISWQLTPGEDGRHLSPGCVLPTFRKSGSCGRIILARNSLGRCGPRKRLGGGNCLRSRNSSRTRANSPNAYRRSKISLPKIRANVGSRATRGLRLRPDGAGCQLLDPDGWRMG